LLTNGCDRRKHTDCLQTPGWNKKGRVESAAASKKSFNQPETLFVFNFTFAATEKLKF